MNGPFRAGTNDAKVFSKHGLLAKLEDIERRASETRDIVGRGTDV
jgi:hypothetical protein